MSERHEKILEYIKSFINEYGFSPTVREICEGVGIASTSTAEYHLRKLVEHGHIIKCDYRSRAYRLAQDDSLSFKTKWNNLKEQVEKRLSDYRFDGHICTPETIELEYVLDKMNELENGE